MENELKEVETDEHIIAIDCDLWRIHAWSNQYGRICYKEPTLEATIEFITSIYPRPTVLFECASPISYRANHQGSMAWYIFNSYTLREITYYGLNCGFQLLVAPSSVWCKQFKEKERHAMFGITGDNHDIRECRCMIQMFLTERSLFVPVPEFLQNLRMSKQ